MEAATAHARPLHEHGDEALALAFRTNEGGRGAEAFTLLLDRMAPVLCARTDAALRRSGMIPRDDLLQEATLAFLSAVTAYRPGKGASLRTFISVCVSNRLSSALRRQAAAPALDEFIEAALPPGYETTDPQDLYAAMEQARLLLRTMQSCLTPLERAVLEAHMDGQRYEAIAKALDVSPKTVDNALQRARRKLQRYL